ncbi:MAG: hypothetical protein WBA76_05425 [Phormidesmis sp.]
MKNLSFLLIGCALGTTLAATNPNHKNEYTDHVADEIQSLCCLSSQNTCTAFRPLTKPMLNGIVHVYTEAPRDYLFFTQYTTYLPGHTVHGIGFAGQFTFWSDSSKPEGACPFFSDATFMPSNMRRSPPNN